MYISICLQWSLLAMMFMSPNALAHGDRELMVRTAEIASEGCDQMAHLAKAAVEFQGAVARAQLAQGLLALLCVAKDREDETCDDRNFGDSDSFKELQQELTDRREESLQFVANNCLDFHKVVNDLADSLEGY